VQAAAFFLLADKLEDAVNICVKNLGDYQLGLVICRLAEGENGPMFQKILVCLRGRPFVAMVAGRCCED
jgi:hypothetical protein